MPARINSSNDLKSIKLMLYLGLRIGNELRRMIKNIRTPAATDLFLLMEHESRSVLFLNPVQIEEGEIEQIQRTKSIIPSGFFYLLDPTLFTEERARAEEMASALNLVLDANDLELYSQGYLDNHREPILDIITQTKRHFSTALSAQWLTSACCGTVINPDLVPIKLSLNIHTTTRNFGAIFPATKLSVLPASMQETLKRSSDMINTALGLHGNSFLDSNLAGHKLYLVPMNLDPAILKLTGARTRKWALTRQSPDLSNVDSHLADAITVRNNYVFEQRAAFFQTLINLRDILGTKVQGSAFWQAALIIDELLPPLAEVITPGSIIRMKDLF